MNGYLAAVRDGFAHLDVREGPPALVGGSAAVFSQCGRYRYALARCWDPDRRPAVFLMLNPSTADAFVDDPTVRRCVGFSRSWDAGGLNAFGLRSTDPAALRVDPVPVGVDNDAVISWHLAGSGVFVGPVVVAWGGDRALAVDGRAARLVGLLKACGVRPVCLGVTKDGHPRHPLYVRGDTVTVEYAGGS